MESSTKALLAAVALAVVLEVGLVGANFQDECDITWEPHNAKMTEGGNHLTLSLVSNSSGKHLITTSLAKKNIYFRMCAVKH